jgi:hypothetical protein
VNGVYVAVGSNGKILTNNDISAWTSRSSLVRNDFMCVGFGNLRFGAAGSGVILYSLCESSGAASTGINNEVPAIDQLDVPSLYGGHGSPADNSYSTSLTAPNRTSPARTQAGSLINTYYIYSFDGKLLAEYDHSGNCISDPFVNLGAA